MRLATLSATTMILGAILGGAVMTAASAWAQMPQYRDERTGKVWTPEIVSEDQYPQTATAYPDKAFDPTTQNARIPGVIQQRPRANLLGRVPLVVIDTPSLQALPGRHWMSILYFTNNSAVTVDGVVDCHFTNQGRKVEDIRVLVPTAGPGDRLGMAVRGPRTDLFVDQVRCEVLSPI